MTSATASNTAMYASLDAMQATYDLTGVQLVAAAPAPLPVTTAPLPITPTPFVFSAVAMPTTPNRRVARPQEHVCQVCAKVFHTHKSLTQHIAVHNDEKPYQCSICEKAFRFKSNLYEHRSMHASANQYRCKLCGKTCRLKGNLKKHLKTHEKNGEVLFTKQQSSSSDADMTAASSSSAHVTNGNGLAELEDSGEPRRVSKHYDELIIDEGTAPSDVETCKLAVSSPTNTMKSPNSSPYNNATPPSVYRTRSSTGSTTRWSNQRLSDLDSLSDVEMVAWMTKRVELEYDRPLNKSPAATTNGLGSLLKDSRLSRIFRDFRALRFGPGGLKCDSCERTFERRRQLFQHVKAEHLESEPYLCLVCVRSFDDIHEFNLHVSHHRRVHELVGVLDQQPACFRQC